MAAKKLLIIHQGALGDFVLTFPAIIGLKRTYRPIDVLCQGKLGKIARKLDLVDNGYALESAAFASLYSEPAGLIDPKVKNIIQTYDQIILFSYSRLLENSLNRISRHKVYRIAPRPPENEKIHVSEYIIKHLKAAKLLPVDKQFNKPFMQKAGAPDGYRQKSVPARTLLHPGSGSRKKNWPLSKFLKLANILRLQQMPSEFILGPAEYDLAKAIEISGLLNPKIHIVSQLEQALSLMHKACGLIGNDSGICHLAAFTGLATLVVFGPTDPAKWKPIGRSVSIVRPDIDCSPCLEKDKNSCDSMKCLRSITPERVYTEFSNLISLGTEC